MKLDVFQGRVRVADIDVKIRLCHIDVTSLTTVRETNSQSVDNARLSGVIFADQNVQARSEVEHDLVEAAEPLNRELG